MIKSFNGKTPYIAKSAFVAENATIIGDVTIGENCSIWYGVVIRGDDGRVVVGDNTNIQDNSVVHTDEELIIGSGVTIGHNAIVHCKKIGDNVMFGMGAIALSGSEIGDNSVLGAGALLTQNKVIPANSVAMGSPAKVFRETVEADVQATKNNADVYVKLGQEHKQLF